MLWLSWGCDNCLDSQVRRRTPQNFTIKELLVMYKGALPLKKLFSKTDTGLTRPNGKHFEKEVFELGGSRLV